MNIFCIKCAPSIVILLCSFVICIYASDVCDKDLYLEDDLPSDCDSKTESKMKESDEILHKKEEIHLSVVACGDRLNETVIMIKSVIFFTQGTNPISIHIFAEENLHEEFKSNIESLLSSSKFKLSYILYPITYTRGEPAVWKKVFKPCATQRLFLPEALPHVDKIMYVDTDVLFFTPIEDVWNHFSKFNSTHIAALTPEHENPNAGWYNRFARHPYYPPLGVNSGVMLMDLEKMREVTWVDYHLKYYAEYKNKITWGDQDLINVFFHYFPEKLYIYPCEWNYRADHCMYGHVCKTATANGIKMVHGSRRYFHLDKQPVFKTIYDTLVEIPINSNLKDFVQQLDDNLNEEIPRKTMCGQVRHLFTHGLKKLIKLNGL